MIEHIITTAISFTVGGLVMMLIGYFTLKYFVRMIMAEIFVTLKERVLDDVGDKKLKKQQKGFVRKY